MDRSKTLQWNFIVSLYALPGIKESCLSLQNTGGVDVIVLLAVVYACAKFGFQPEHRQLVELDRLAARLRTNFILPLRALRTSLDDAPPSVPSSDPQRLRAAILEAELCAERQQLVLLADYIESLPQHSPVSDIDAAVGLVCAFYFEKMQTSADQIGLIRRSLNVFSRAVSSLP